ncbi:MAG TPA: DUF4160 domain-containing protein [Anaerovoracaceae bacterium]|nr:DUF4160 domain-containing protein [Anaerovoracaceae bacterium]
MPVITRFYGIVIKMQLLGKEHSPPHIHVIYGEYFGSISILTFEMTVGDLPAKVLSMVRKWTKKYQRDLLDMWNTQQFKSLPPLEKATRHYIEEEKAEYVFHRVKTVAALPGYMLLVHFLDGTAKQYDVKPLFQRFEVFNQITDPAIFSSVVVDRGGFGISWNDDVDLACNELWNNGTEISTPFDNLIAFGDATDLWNLHESTLRKAVSYGKLIDGVDVRKFGKQWLITRAAMVREYGQPPDGNEKKA